MNKSRINSLDVLRIIAAIAVVVFHVVGSSATNDSETSKLTLTIVTAFISSLQWHVPIFFMITGYLWLSEGKVCTYDKIFKSIKRYIYVLFTFGFVYALMERYFISRTFSMTIIFESLQDVIKGNLWDHMWFIYSIIGIYLVLPVFNSFFNNSSLKEIINLTLLLFIFTIVSPVLETTFNFPISISFPINAPMFYICIGGLISKFNLSQHQIARFSLLTFSCSVIIVLLIGALVPNGYIPLFTCISAVSLFVFIIIFLKDMPAISWIQNFSNCTFGIYLIHPFFINVMLKLLHIYPFRFMPLISILLACIVITGISFVTTYSLRKIGFVKRNIL